MPTPLPSTDGLINLVVAWQSAHSIEARFVKTEDDINTELRRTARAALERASHPIKYSPDAALEDGLCMIAPRDEFLDQDLLTSLAKGGSLPLASSSDLRPNKTGCCYAVLVGNANPMIFIRRRTPIVNATQTIRARLVSGALVKIEEPLLAFDGKFDAIVVGDSVYILDQNGFEKLFSAESTTKAVNRWVNKVACAIPIEEGGDATLAHAVADNMPLRRRLHAAANQPYLAHVTLDTLREAIKAQKANPDEYLGANGLRLTRTNVRFLLQVLNDDLFQGQLSEHYYAAGTKTRRS